MDKLPLKKRYKRLHLRPKNIKVERLTGDVSRTTISFDLSGVPDNMEIKSAKLQTASGNK